MATTGYDDWILLVEVSGLRQQDVMPTSHYTFKVPYRSLARTLQFIRCKGGKIVRIHSPSSSLPIQQLFQTSASLEAIKAQSLPPESALAASEPTQPSVVAETEELASPLMSKSKTLELSKLSRLVRLFLKKLNHPWVRSE